MVVKFHGSNVSFMGPLDMHQGMREAYAFGVSKVFCVRVINESDNLFFILRSSIIWIIWLVTRLSPIKKRENTSTKEYFMNQKNLESEKNVRKYVKNLLFIN